MNDKLLEMNFINFILSLSTSAMMHFGDIPDPVTNEKKKNIALAKQTIDILGMLKDKTKGNLTKEEENVIDELLYNLRLRYINETKK
jgi:hypothetical protein